MKKNHTVGLSKALFCATLDSVNPVLYPSIDTILCVLLNMPAAKKNHTVGKVSKIQ
jgi:hypothetical protein